MTLGLYSAPRTFQRLTNLEFADMLNKFIIVFFDNILVFYETQQKHLMHLRKVFDSIKSSKIHFKLKVRI